jgi:hypothetical protein
MFPFYFTTTLISTKIGNQFEPQASQALGKVHNKIASLFYDGDCYGPAVLIVRKSVSVVVK